MSCQLLKSGRYVRRQKKCLSRLSCDHYVDDICCKKKRMCECAAPITRSAIMQHNRWQCIMNFQYLYRVLKLKKEEERLYHGLKNKLCFRISFVFNLLLLFHCFTISLANQVLVFDGGYFHLYFWRRMLVLLNFKKAYISLFSSFLIYIKNSLKLIILFLFTNIKSSNIFLKAHALYMVLILK